jgi:hypothetical protein
MSCVHFGGGIVTLTDIYRFQGFTFEWHYFCGPIPVHKRTLDPIKTIPTGFWKMVEQWQKLPKKEWEKYRV